MHLCVYTYKQNMLYLPHNTNNYIVIIEWLLEVDKKQFASYHWAAI